MKILVIGAGLIGVTTAYFLQRRGHEVMVVDRASGAGLETSFANGALLVPSMSEPWNTPGCWRTLATSLFSSTSPLKVYLGQIPQLTSWGLKFLSNSRVSAYKRNTYSNLRLSSYSVEVMQALRSETQVDYKCARTGTLRIFRDPKALQRAWVNSQGLSGGITWRKLDPLEVSQLEPTLTPIVPQLHGGLYCEQDESGDSHQFCNALAECARQAGVQFLFNTEVLNLEVRGDRVDTVVRGNTRMFADRVVLAAASFSRGLCRTVGLDLPVQPAKGYSVTLRNTGLHPRLRVPIVDDQLHAVIVPLGDEIRVAGTAEFSGYDLRIDPARVDGLLALIKDVLPRAQVKPAETTSWCGLRPMSVDGVPIIGSTTVPNLWINTGHGHLGWTQAAGSATLLADMLSERRPAIDPRPFEFARFLGANPELLS